MQKSFKRVKPEDRSTRNPYYRHMVKQKAHLHPTLVINIKSWSIPTSIHHGSRARPDSERPVSLNSDNRFGFHAPKDHMEKFKSRYLVSNRDSSEEPAIRTTCCTPV